MKLFAVLFAILPALVLAQDGGGLPVENMGNIPDNPAISSSTAAQGAVVPAVSPVVGVAPIPAPVEGETAHVATGTDAAHSATTSVLAPSGAPSQTNNSTPPASPSGANGTNSTGGAEPYARTMPIAALLAAAGAVGAMMM